MQFHDEMFLKAKVWFVLTSFLQFPNIKNPIFFATSSHTNSLAFTWSVHFVGMTQKPHL